MGAETISDLVHNSSNASIVRAQKLLPGRIAQHPVATILRRRARIVGYTVLGAFVFACIYLLLARRTYISTAEVYIVGSPSGAPINDFLTTQCQLMTSMPVLALALSQDGIKELETISVQADPIEFLKQNIQAQVARDSELVDVSLEAPGKPDTAKIVNAVVQAYITFQTQMHQGASAEVLELLQNQKAHDQDVIAGDNQQLATLHNLQNPIPGSAQNSASLLQDSALSNALNAARLEAADAKSQYDQAMAMAGNDPELLSKILAPASPNDPAAPSPDQLLQAKAEILQNQLAIQDMERTYLPDHPRVLLARSQQNQLIVTYVRAQRQRWLSAQARQSTLQESFDHLHKQVLDQATLTANLHRLSSELASTEKDLDAVNTSISQLGANPDAGGFNVEITQPAVPALYPSHPAKLKTLSGWLLAGLVLGCGLALGLEKLSPGSWPINESSLHLGAPVIGVIPSIPASLSFPERALQSHIQPSGPVAETSRSIARVIVESPSDEIGGHTLLIAGMNPSEGRTTLAANLAIAMAQGGKKILLVDANNRLPRLHQVFNLKNDFGLFDLLQGRAAQQHAPQSTMVQNVDVLTAGTITDRSVELLNTELLVDVLGDLSDQYDRVIVDSPALGRGVESRILAANCAAAILVTAARSADRHQVGHGLAMLQSVGANVLGLVLNESGSWDSNLSSKTNLPPARDPLSADKARSFRKTLASGTED